MVDRPSRSLASERQQQLAEIIAQRGEARVAALAAEIGVSEMTIRRDLDRLDAMGLVSKVHGGATMRRELSADEPHFEIKAHRNIEEKAAIGAACADLITGGTAVGITAGTTSLAVARQLRALANLTVVTNSLGVAQIFYETPRPDLTVVLTGGVRTPSNALVGPTAIGSLRSFHLDVTIMGVHGMQEASGFTTPNMLEAEANKAFIESASRLIVVADHSKWDTLGLITIAPLEGADVVVTDEGLEQSARTTLAKHVGQLIIAPVSGRRGAETPQAATA